MKTANLVFKGKKKKKTINERAEIFETRTNLKTCLNRKYGLITQSIKKQYMPLCKYLKKKKKNGILLFAMSVFFSYTKLGFKYHK